MNTSDDKNYKPKDKQSADNPEQGNESVDTEMAEIEANLDRAIEEQQALEQARIEAQREQVKAQDEQFKDLSLLEDDEHDSDEPLKCLNCGATMKGAYCHVCGQPERNYIRFFPRVLWEMINEAFDLDSKIFRTIIPLMFSPGRLTLEYIAGRRATYINPLRLYIVTSIVFFIAISLLTDPPESLGVTDGEGTGVKSRQDIEQVAPSNPGQDVIDGLQTGYNSGETPQSEATQALESAISAEATELAQFQAMLDVLKEKQATGFPVPMSSIRTLEEALEDGVIESGERGLFVNEQDKLDIDLDDGTEWHPISNPINYNLDVSTEFNQEINNYLWRSKGKLYEVKDNPADLIDEVLDIFPQLMFLLLPIFALLLKIVYIYKRRFYMEHLITALHSHSFIFFSLLFILLLGEFIEGVASETWVAETMSWLIVALIIWIPVNLLLQQKRIYAQGKFLTFIKFIIVGVSYVFLLTATAFGAFVLGLGSV